MVALGLRQLEGKHSIRTLPPGAEIVWQLTVLRAGSVLVGSIALDGMAAGDRSWGTRRALGCFMGFSGASSGLDR